MILHSAKPRTVRFHGDVPSQFPARVRLEIELGPKWLFDPAGSSPRHVVPGSKGVGLQMDFNTGRFHVIGGQQPAITSYASAILGDVHITIAGAALVAEFELTGPDDLAPRLDAFLYLLPACLTVMLEQACTVVAIRGCVDSSEFGYEMLDVPYQLFFTSDESRSEQLDQAFGMMGGLSDESARRMLASIVYFSRAARLVETGDSRFEFMAEAILNLAKSLEVLFPAGQSVESRDAVRAGLSRAGVSTADAEAYFIPLLVLRSELDVAHPKLALPRRDQVESLIKYCGGAIDSTRNLLQLIYQRIQEGAPVVVAWERSESSDIQNTLDKFLNRVLLAQDSWSKDRAST
jgi:hypothetical protein